MRPNALPLAAHRWQPQFLEVMLEQYPVAFSAHAVSSIPLTLPGKTV